MGIRTVLRAGALAVMLAVPLLLAPVADAKVFKWANDGDVNSMDPYSRNETFLNAFLSNIYEPLMRRDKHMKLEPALAVKQSNPSPTIWRWDLRHGVKFHDGTPFTADDVVFSINRANGPGSNMTGYFASFKSIRKVDDYTVEIETKYPDPVLGYKLASIFIMSKKWCEEHNAVHTAELTKNEENYATRHANGTGPFVLKDREPDVKTTLVPNPNWWDKPEHNLTQVIFSRIANAATRTAALLSGEIDFIYTVPPQDVDRIKRSPDLKTLEGPETRVVYLGFDQARNELLESNVKGKNPFKDIRVREAFVRAIDEPAIVKTVMRGQATDDWEMVAPGINGYVPDLNHRPKYDPALSKKLLTEAGYPNGFEVGMDCPNDRYVKDEAICQAVVAMLAKVGVKVNLLAQTRSKYFAKILGPGYNTSFFMLGWSPAATYDVHNVFEQLIQTRDPARHKGLFNVGGYSNKKFDELADKIEQETNETKRNAMIAEAHKIYQNDYGMIPLHQQALIWAMRKNIDVVQTPDNNFQLRWVRVN